MDQRIIDSPDLLKKNANSYSKETPLCVATEMLNMALFGTIFSEIEQKTILSLQFKPFNINFLFVELLP